MRILTVRNPAAWAIIYAGKNVENRTRSLGPYRGPVAILAAREVLAEDHPFWDHDVYRDAFSSATAAVRHRVDVRGAIIGVVDLVASHAVDEVGCMAAINICSPWADTAYGTHHLRFENARAVVGEPIPWRGALGLRKTTLDVVDDALIDVVNRCTCGTGPLSYQHEPMCGAEYVAQLEATR